MLAIIHYTTAYILVVYKCKERNLLFRPDMRITQFKNIKKTGR
jgi:hypothetical protein